jgi:hypothetical protein
MTHSALISVLGSEFDDFLFSRIGKDKNDTPLSVLSALARLGIDPWQEAAELARLPRETAIERLAFSIAALPDRASAHPEQGTIAARLIALLPRQTSSETLTDGTLANEGDVTKFRAGIYMSVVLIALTLVAQWAVASRQPAPVGNVDASASSAAFPRMPSPDSDPPITSEQPE